MERHAHEINVLLAKQKPKYHIFDVDDTITYHLSWNNFVWAIINVYFTHLVLDYICNSFITW